MRWSIFILFSSLILSCSEKKEEIPSDIIPKEKFISLLIDMYTIEGKYSHSAVINKPVYDEGVKEFVTLFKKYGTTKKEVSNTIDFYSQNPEEMKQIQMIVLDSLNIRSSK